MRRARQQLDSASKQPASEKSQSESTKSKGGDDDKKVPLGNFVRIITYGNRRDHLVLLVALLAATASGVALPLSNIIFGKLIGNFNSYFVPGGHTTERQFKHSVSQNALYFVYLFIAKFVLTYISTVSCPMSCSMPAGYP